MPQRFLRPGITNSPKWNGIGYFEQSFYIRILTLVDDYGRYDGDARILRGHGFALRDDVTLSMVEYGLSVLQKADLLTIYEAQGKKVIQLTNWFEKARSASRYPAFDNNCKQLLAIENNCSPPSPSPSPQSSPAPSVSASAQTMMYAEVPTWNDVKTYASMHGVTETSAKNFYDHHENNQLWFNKHNRLIKWQGSLISWANKDREMHASGSFNGKPNHQSIDRNAGTANAGLASMYDIDTNANR